MDVLKFVLKIVMMLLIPAVVAISAYRYVNTMFREPFGEADGVAISFIVTPDDSFDNICTRLEEQGLLRASWVLTTLQKLKAKDLSVKAGEYEFLKGSTPAELLEKFKAGDIVIREFSLEPGESIWLLPPRIEEAGLAIAADVEKAMVDRELLAQAGVRADSFEGYLGTGTFTFTKGDSVETMLLHLFRMGQENWHESYDTVAESLNLSRHEVLTLASLIQADASHESLQGMLSGVFHNSLNNMRKLKSPASAEYGLPEEERARGLRPESLRKAHPYNTYIQHGLPPGPVSNPGVSAIVAALYPEIGEHQFFTFDPAVGETSFFVDEGSYREAFIRYKDSLLTPEELAALEAEREALRQKSLKEISEKVGIIPDQSVDDVEQKGPEGTPLNPGPSGIIRAPSAPR